jgi:hypothetical protein
MTTRLKVLGGSGNHVRVTAGGGSWTGFLLGWLLVATLSALVFACRGESGDAGANAGAGGAGSPIQGSAGDRDRSDCDDGLSCTIDVFVGASCTHSVGPNEGVTACPRGKYCVAKSGCVVAPTCARDSDCAKAWADDPCKVNAACDHASGVCVFDLLDHDGDGFPPASCGGADCDDADASRFPAATEACDGKDNDCDGDVDTGASCDDEKLVCENGACACKPENSCGSRCVDKQTDAFNCGECDHRCAQGAACVDGSCTCQKGQTECDGSCWDLKNEAAHCGACGTSCRPRDQTCIDAVCGCSQGFTECDGTCTDLTTDAAHCGSCDTACSGYLRCDNGTCNCLDTMCGDVCTDLSLDHENCGACGNACDAQQTCQFRKCKFL